MNTPALAALAVTGALLAALGLSSCGDTTTSDYDYQRAEVELPEIVPVPTPTYDPPRFGMYGALGE